MIAARRWQANRDHPRVQSGPTSVASLLNVPLSIVRMLAAGQILTARRFGSQSLDVILLLIRGVARMKSIPEKNLGPGQGGDHQ